MDDHCFVSLARRPDGGWGPSTWISKDAAELIRMYTGVYGIGMGDDCPPNGHIEQAVADHGRPQEGCPDCAVGHSMSQFFNRVYEAKGAAMEADLELASEVIDTLEEDLILYRALFKAERSVSGMLLKRVLELEEILEACHV